MNKRVINHYPEEFKKSSAQLAAESNQPISQVAQELGIHITTLYTWLKKYYPNNAIKENQSNEALQEELKRLRKELARKEQECEILKKASADFAKQMQ